MLCLQNVLTENKHIYPANYEGWYCVSDEAFLTSAQLREKVDENGKKIFVSEESGHPVEWTEEKNYLFRLSNFQDDLIHWLKSNGEMRKINNISIEIKFLYRMTQNVRYFL